MEKEKGLTAERVPENIHSADEQSGKFEKMHPFILEEEAESAIGTVNKIIWIMFGLLLLGIIVGSFRSAL